MRRIRRAMYLDIKIRLAQKPGKDHLFVCFRILCIRRVEHKYAGGHHIDAIYAKAKFPGEDVQVITINQRSP